MRRSVAAAVLVGLPCLLVVAALPTPGRGADPAGSPMYTSAAECGRCHQELYQSWRRTYHAQATQNSEFLADLERLDADYGRGLRVLCLSCHSPTTLASMDYSLAHDISREGVTCDFCHTVSAVDLSAPGMKLSNDLSPVKRGPGRPDSMAAHRTSPNPLILQSDFCAGCHQWTNPLGIAVLDTYREWASSFYRGEGAQCQLCHMPEILKTTILLQGKKVERPSHLHMEMGGHSQTQLATAATLDLSVSQRDNTVEARTVVENFKGGHRMPTGIPSRSIVLRVALVDNSGNVLERQEKVFRRVLGDADGRPLDRMISWYQNAAKVLEDTRIAPKERRSETFIFRLPEKAGTVFVRAGLFYRVTVSSLSPPSLDYEMASAQRIVGSGHGGRDLGPGLAAALAIVILVVIFSILIKFRVNREPE